MGKDKEENELLIKYGIPEDVWFHVDDLSSAHVYLRQKKGETLDDITPEQILECSSLVKANSISGSKMNSVYVVYTRWKNLKKTNDIPETNIEQEEVVVSESQQKDKPEVSKNAWSLS